MTEQLVKTLDTLSQVTSLGRDPESLLGQSFNTIASQLSNPTRQFAEAVQWVREGQKIWKKPIQYLESVADMGQKLEASIEENPTLSTIRTLKGMVQQVKNTQDQVQNILHYGNQIIDQGRNWFTRLYPHTRRTQKKPKTLTDQLRQHHRFIRKDLHHHQTLKREHQSINEKMSHLKDDQGKNLNSSHGSNIFDHRVKGLHHGYDHVRFPHELPLTRSFKTTTDATQSSSVLDMRPILQMADAPKPFHRHVTVI